jgi:hypothetical protein
MSNALREAALHGEAFYSQLLLRCREVAQATGLASNPNFDAPDYSVRRSEMRNRTFTAWVLPVQLQSGDKTSATMMSVSTNIAPPNSGELSAVEGAPATTSVGKIETGGELLTTPVEPLSSVL